MLLVKLTQLVSESDSVNQKYIGEVTGRTEELPTLGRGFVMYSEKLHPTKGLYRIIHTPAVERIEQEEGDNKMLFYANNSVYELKILDGKDPTEDERTMRC